MATVVVARASRVKEKSSQSHRHGLWDPAEDAQQHSHTQNRSPCATSFKLPVTREERVQEEAGPGANWEQSVSVGAGLG